MKVIFIFRKYSTQQENIFVFINFWVKTADEEKNQLGCRSLRVWFKQVISWKFLRVLWIFLWKSVMIEWNTVFDAVQSPLCLVPPCEIGRILVFEKIFNKIFSAKNYAFELTVNKIFYFCLIFLFKCDEIIIKQPSSCTFGMNVVKF